MESENKEDCGTQEDRQGSKKKPRRYRRRSIRRETDENKIQVVDIDMENNNGDTFSYENDNNNTEEDKTVDNEVDLRKFDQDIEIDHIDRRTKDIQDESDIIVRLSLDSSLKSPPAMALEEYNDTKMISFKEHLSEEHEQSSLRRHGSIIEGKFRIHTSKSYETEGEDEVTLRNENQIINVRALTKNAKTYELEKFRKNALIIFNQENVDGYELRRGTRKDAEALANTFGRFNFDVVEYLDLTRAEIFRELKAFTEKDFTDYGCVAVAILTHGSERGYLRARDHQPYYESDILNFFKTHDKPTLITKPKIVIIQACRGWKVTQAANVGFRANIMKDVSDFGEPYTLPVESDMLLLHSTYAGNASHRDELHGSWFIQTLCQKINQLAFTHDFESIVTEVKRDVAIDKWHTEYNRGTYKFDTNKQMPVLTSTLIRKLYLKKYGERSSVVGAMSLTLTEFDSGMEQLASSNHKCSCTEDRFEYLRSCIRHFVEEHPFDETAKSFLEVAETLEEGAEFSRTKEKISKAIRNYLMNSARHCDYYKYLYFYRD